MIEIRHAEMTDAERLLEIYGYYVRQTAVTFEYDIPTPGEFRERMIRTLPKITASTHRIKTMSQKIFFFFFINSPSLSVLLD